jgi:hypothetical protein
VTKNREQEEAYVASQTRGHLLFLVVMTGGRALVLFSFEIDHSTGPEDVIR